MKSVIEHLSTHSYLQVPRWLTKLEIDIYAKLLYIILLDLAKVAEQTYQQDENGIYVYYTLEQAQKILLCGKDRAIKSFRALEEAELIQRVQRGLNKANIYYVCLPDIPPDMELPPKRESAASSSSAFAVYEKVKQKEWFSNENSTIDHELLSKENYRPPF